jgi:hypothetical protein
METISAQAAGLRDMLVANRRIHNRTLTNIKSKPGTEPHTSLEDCAVCRAAVAMLDDHAWHV